MQRTMYQLFHPVTVGSVFGRSSRKSLDTLISQHKPLEQTNLLRLYFTEDVAVITMNAGENWIVPAMAEEFMALLDEVERNPKCRGLITTGVGKFYANGISSSLVWGMNASTRQAFLRATRLLLQRILFFPVPTLAAINGHCFGFGAIMAFAHDVRTMRVDRGWLCFNEVNVGAQFANYMMPFLKDKIGTGKVFSDCLVLGRRFNAEVALKDGLVHAVAPENTLLEDSKLILKDICGQTDKIRQSLINIKNQVYKTTLDASNAEDDTYDLFPLLPKL